MRAEKIFMLIFITLGLLYCVLGLLLFSGPAKSATVQMTRTWTAPGDDGNVGTASGYELRYTTDTLRPWSTWIDPQPSAPKIAGSLESFTFAVDLDLGVNYWFAIRAVDDAGNWSERSNLVLVNLPDTVPPNTIVDFR